MTSSASNSLNRTQRAPTIIIKALSEVPKIIMTAIQIARTLLCELCLACSIFFGFKSSLFHYGINFQYVKRWLLRRYLNQRRRISSETFEMMFMISKLTNNLVKREENYIIWRISFKLPQKFQNSCFSATTVFVDNFWRMSNFQKL